MLMLMVSALYVDPKGPYPAMDGVDPWDEQRDARLYEGQHPIVAHPPCGPWGRLSQFCTLQDPTLAPFAVEQVRRWGGVLEHPEYSRLWNYCRLPKPGEFPDEWGGYSVAVTQVSWGHCLIKPTWLYIVGVPLAEVCSGIRTGGEPTRKTSANRTYRPDLKNAGPKLRRLTPPAFAEWLVSIARRVAIMGAM